MDRSEGAEGACGWPDSTRENPAQKGAEQSAGFLWVIRGAGSCSPVRWDTKTGSLCFRKKRKNHKVFLGDDLEHSMSR